MSDSIFDVTMFEQLLRNSGNGGPMLVEMFLDSTPAKLAAMSGALETGDFTRIRDIAHALIASVGMLGILEMQRLAVRIHDAASERREADLPPLLAEILDAYERARPLIEARYSRRARPPKA